MQVFSNATSKKKYFLVLSRKGTTESWLRSFDRYFRLIIILVFFLNLGYPFFHSLNFVLPILLIFFNESLIANNNIRSVILEIKNDRCKIVKILIFRSLYRERFQSKWKCCRYILLQIFKAILIITYINLKNI